MSEYGKRTAPVAARALSPEALALWRNRARTLLLQAIPEGGAAGGAEHASSIPSDSSDASHPSDASDGAPDPAQRRHALRQKTLIGAQVVFNDLMSTYNCTIRDLSESGARVKLNAPVQVPQSFMLRFNDGRVRQCKVRRRNALELGIEFLD